VISRRDFYPYGEQISGVGGRSQIPSYNLNHSLKQKFTGYERDDETGLDFAQARYYKTVMGRFTSPDPFSDSADQTAPQTWNRYSYTLNNPLIYVDPDGLFALPAKKQRKQQEQDIKDKVFIFIPVGKSVQGFRYKLDNGQKGFVPARQFEKLNSNPNRKLDVVVVRGKRATLKAYQKAIERTDVFAVIFIGHADDINVDGVRELRFSDARATSVEIAETSQLTCLFGCNTSTLDSSIKLNPGQILATVVSGNDGTSLGLLSAAAYLIAEQIVVNPEEFGLESGLKAANKLFNEDLLLTNGLRLSKFPKDKDDGLKIRPPLKGE
jgi:RHS repeat-associated protein